MDVRYALSKLFEVIIDGIEEEAEKLYLDDIMQHDEWGAYIPDGVSSTIPDDQKAKYFEKAVKKYPVLLTDYLSPKCVRDLKCYEKRP